MRKEHAERCAAASTAAPPSTRQRVGAMVALPALLKQFDAEPEVVLSASGLATDALADPERTIPYDAWGRLLECSAAATQHPQIGLLAGRLWHLDDLGLLGAVVRNCATVGEALHLLTARQDVDSTGGLAFLVRRAAIVDLGYAVYSPGTPGIDQIYDTVLAAAFNFMRELCDVGWTPTEVFLPHGRPHDVSVYRDVFKVSPRFDSEFCALRFPAHVLDRRIADARPEVRREGLENLHRTGALDLLNIVHRSLRVLLLHGKSSGDDLAGLLAMHRRTLNRRLRDVGTTFQDVLDEVRFEVARQLLSYSELPLDDVAASLGYAGVSPFMRSFRRWTGITPGQWRRDSAEERVRIAAATGGRAGARSLPALPLLPPQGPWRGQHGGARHDHGIVSRVPAEPMRPTSMRVVTASLPRVRNGGAKREVANQD
jgi:AraC-like DNA-binding protein